MAISQRLSEIGSLETARPAMWVASADAYGHIMPEPEDARYIITRALGVSELAVRGYDDGQPVKLAIGSIVDPGVIVGDKTYSSGLRPHNHLYAVPTDKQDEFEAAIRLPDPRTVETAHKLVQVLEQGIAGNWTLWSPGGLYDDPDYSFAEFTYDGESLDAVGVVDYDYSPQEHPYSSGYAPRGDKPFTPARIAVDGPTYKFVPVDGSRSFISGNSIADRVSGLEWVNGQELSGEQRDQLSDFRTSVSI